MPKIPVSDRARKRLSKQIGYLISKSGLSEAEVARRAQMTPQWLNDIVKGEKYAVPNPQHMRALAAVLGVDMLDLWLIAYSDLIPEGYEIAPIDDGMDDDDRVRQLLLQRHPELARFFDWYLGLPDFEAGRVMNVIDALRN